MRLLAIIANHRLGNGPNMSVPPRGFLEQPVEKEGQPFLAQLVPEIATSIAIDGIPNFSSSLCENSLQLSGGPLMLNFSHKP